MSSSFKVNIPLSLQGKLLISATWPDVIVDKYFLPKRLGSKTFSVSMENNFKDDTIISESMLKVNNQQ